jgi:hypothetical protein
MLAFTWDCSLLCSDNSIGCSSSFEKILIVWQYKNIDLSCFGALQLFGGLAPAG